MTRQEGCLTVTWKIHNFSVLLKAKGCCYLQSPSWVVECTEDGTLSPPVLNYVRMYATIYEHSYWDFTFYVNGFDMYPAQFEMSFISSWGDVLLQADPSCARFDLPDSARFNKNRQSILLNDTLTLCCKTWGKAIKTAECHIATVLHSLNHLWAIEKVASSIFHNTYVEQEHAKFHVSLIMEGYSDYKVLVELDPHAPDNPSVVYSTLSVKDDFECVFKCKKCSTFNSATKSKCLFQISSSSQITVVTLQLELIVALCGRPQLPASSQVVREAPLKPNSPTNSVKHKNVSGALGDDFLLLYREGALSDATLNTEGQSFSAHRAVLAARSPVFRAMFEKDETSEGRSGVVDIDDVDSETMDRLLVYLYADSVGDLAFKEASALYYAADKYEILPLKEKCGYFLKNCLSTDNACDVLVLADRHSDQELMTCVVDFIFGHEAVVSSAQWEELEKGNPMLCAKVVKQLFLKKGKK